MAIDVRELRALPLDPEIEEELTKFEDGARRYIAGEIDDDVFRVFRLNQGVYGQRQGGYNQMLRVKIPYGQVEPDQLEMLGYLSETYSRGWGHLTTRQNVQFHFVQLEQVGEALRLLASVGLTSREACGDTVRNVAGCHLAGACPYEVLDISPWAEAAKALFLRNPLSQRLPRKFKINFSGCATDCGQAMFNDVGVIAVNRPLPDGTVEPGFKVFIAGGLGANPHPAQALEEFTSREDLLPTIEAILRVENNHGNRDNKLRARLKWLVDTMGIDELRERVLKERKFLPASATYAGGIPAAVAEHGDAPAGMGTTVSAEGGLNSIVRSSVDFQGLSAYQKWELGNVVRGRANGTVSAYAWARLGDITGDQFRGLAQIQRDFGVEIRITNRQNFALRGLTEAQLPDLHERLSAIGMAEAGAELAARRRLVPRRRHVQPRGHAVTRSRRRHRRRVGERGAGRGRWDPHQHLRLHELVRPAPHRRHRLPRHRAPRPRSRRPRVPHGARRARRRHGDRVRAKGGEAAGQARRRRRSCGSSASSPASATRVRRSGRGWRERAARPRSARR